MNTQIQPITDACFLQCKELIDGNYYISCEKHGDHGVFTKKPLIAGTIPVKVADQKFYFRADYWSFLALCN